MSSSNGTDVTHASNGYDPVKAHEYYIKNRKLKGRKSGSGEQASQKTFAGIAKTASATRTKQKQELSARIASLSNKLSQLNALIQKKEHEAASENRKSKAKKERAAKEADKPKTAAEKAKIARDNAKYRDKHKQELANKAKKASSKSSGSSSKTSTTTSSPGASVDDLKALSTKVKGQIAVAKAKLSAL